MANILILGVKVPFTRGGQDVLVGSLAEELRKRQHEVDIVELPFQCPPHDDLLKQAALWRSISFAKFGGKTVHLVIATKFPSYYAKHPKKSLWLVHQHRPLYDLYGGNFGDFTDDPRDEATRRMLMDGDRVTIGECAYRAAISANVSKRLLQYNDLSAEVLYPPLPLAGSYRSNASENYILSVGRLCGIKRVDLMLKSMSFIYDFVKLKIVGTPDEPQIMEYFKNEIRHHRIEDRVEFLGRVPTDALVDLYSKALAVYYAPHDEDYGYVTLEAFASGKPVVTASDSGGVLEFVSHGANGLVVEPKPEAIGQAFNSLVEGKDLAQKYGQAGLKLVERLGLLQTGGWDKVINSLLSPL